ncbi:hypothetical protein SDC9_173343 [bioreactor metagenome]|uniref:IPTL-CTERM protein sorting domain-containing protein n=1 Tax=bioreactor metagenome TaxID=1076179 RepID=A0A645GJ52_9ZZZZ
MTIALTPPPASSRYSSTCGTSITLAPGASSNVCTITATPNAIPGDGDVNAPLVLANPAAGAGYLIGTPSQANVQVKDDDVVAPPTATLSCSPTTLVDSANQVATCTVSLSTPAPAGGLNVSITPPAANNRYSTTCATPIAIAAGGSTGTCIITAAPNTVAGDGSAAALIQLIPATGYDLGAKTQDTVTINDDDQAVAATPVPTLSQWTLICLSSLVVLFGIGAKRIRVRS